MHRSFITSSGFHNARSTRGIEMKSSNRILSLLAGSTLMGIALTACMPEGDNPIEPGIGTSLSIGCGTKDVTIDCRGDDGSSYSGNMSLNVICDSSKKAMTVFTQTPFTRDRASENCRLDNANWKVKNVNGVDVFEFKCAEVYGEDGTIFKHQLKFTTSTSGGQTTIKGRLDNANYYYPIYREDSYIKDTFETDANAQKGSSYCTFSYAK